MKIRIGVYHQMIYQLKITLKRMSPPVWRRIQVDSGTSFLVLHRLIQEAFDWEDAHLHEFSLKSTNGNQLPGFASSDIRIGSDRDSLGIGSILDETVETIGDHLIEEKDKALYTYDFGDDWQHEILLESLMFPEENTTYPQCVKAKGQAPEEDSRGMSLDEKEFDLGVNEIPSIREINKRFQKYSATPNVNQEKLAEQKNWHELFQAVDAFKQVKPWHYFWDDQIIIIEHPDTGERAYCSVMGKSEMEFGLAIYLGDDGLKSLYKMMENPNEITEEHIIEQRSLILFLSNRDELVAEDYSLIKQLGLRFRGSNQWPSFRSFKPGYYPWFLDYDEIHHLRFVLEQIIEVTNEFKHSPQSIPVYSSGEWFARLPTGKASGVNWEHRMITPELKKTNKESAGILVSEIEVKRLKKRLKHFNGIVEFDAHYFPEPVRENEEERPYYPRMVLAAEPKEGMMLFNNMLRPEQYEHRLQTTFLEMLETIDGVPAEIWIETEESFQILNQLLEAFSVRIVKVDQLPAITHFRKEMAESMGLF